MGKYYIGIDGGGTGSTVLISDGKKDVAVLEVNGFNYNSFSKEVLNSNVKQIVFEIEKLGLHQSDIHGIVLGSAGISNATAKGFLTKCFQNAGFTCRMIITGDEVIAMRGAFGTKKGILLISGTGSICYGQNEGGTKRFRAGGYGHIIDDGGSGYALGRDLLSEAVRESDGRAERTILLDAIYQEIKVCSIEELIAYVYDKNHTKKDVASLAVMLNRPEIAELEAVKRIIKNASKELELCVKAVYTKMTADAEQEEIPFVMMGSVLLKNKSLQKQLILDLKEDLPFIKICQPETDAVHGAVMMALM